MLKADFIVVGIGMNLFAAGLTVFLLQVVYGNPGVTPPAASVTLPGVPLGPLADVPVIGPALQRPDPAALARPDLRAARLLLPVPVALGVHLRAVGEDAAAAEAAGIQ